MSRPATVIRQLIAEDPDTAVERALARLQAPDATTYCLRHSCNKKFTWDRQGRAPRFCSDRCRVQFYKERARLEADLDAYGELLALQPTWARATEIEGHMTLLRMQLLRYRFGQE